MVKIRNKEYNNRLILWYALNVLIIMDIVLILIQLFLDVPQDIDDAIQIFDFFVCIILLSEFFIKFYLSKPKKTFLNQKSNWYDLIASIPYDVVLPHIFSSLRILRLVRILKLLRVVVLFSDLLSNLNEFFDKTNMTRIGIAVMFIIAMFTGLFYVFGPTYNIYDDFYFVVVTLATVGYGDITPVTYNEKVISVVLIITGIFVFSTITAAISSFFTDKLITEDEKKNFDSMEDKLTSMEDDLKDIKKENEKLHEEIMELKELIKEGD